MSWLKHVLWFWGFLFFGSHMSMAQSQKIKWITFEQLEDSLMLQPKKVFVDFYADWCVYCKKMDQAAFQDSEIIKELNTNYYAVKMNTESQDSILFGGNTFYNKELGLKRNPTHEIPLLLGSREGKPFSLPVILILDEKFQVINRYFEYLSPRQLKKKLGLK